MWRRPILFLTLRIGFAIMKALSFIPYSELSAMLSRRNRMQKISLPKSSKLLTSEFIFGVATSSFQIEGAADERELSIWDTFCATPGRIKDESDGLRACEHIKRWREDVKLISDL